ncbi:ABC transporter permease [Planotetraspora sp. GP83]|uniref:ABC transporter permease n=1 Tax=Planotetraspora sp. GP83 TaxID=3156264 RepID=UPI0035167380
MTTTSTMTPTTLNPQRVDPSAVVARTTSRSSVQESWVQILAMAWRAVKKMRRKPEQFFDVLIQPLLFTAMFAFIFGGAISGSVSDYLPVLIPGILAQTALTVCMATGVQLREDMDKGVFDRFKSLPIARIAPLAGPMIADLIRYGIASVLTLVTGLVIGYRPGGGVLGCVGGVALTVIAGWSLAWIFTWLGTMARSAQSVQGISMMIMFPLTFLSNAFVPAETLPGWLEAFVKVNPVSHVVSAVRDLFNDGAVTAEVGWALIGCVVVVAVFAPLAVRSYSRKM